jgi:hypothetical protein
MEIEMDMVFWLRIKMYYNNTAVYGIIAQKP